MCCDAGQKENLIGELYLLSVWSSLLAIATLKYMTRYLAITQILSIKY
jgi:hypothetical protein